MLLRRLVLAMLALGTLAGAASATASRSAAPVGHVVFSEQRPCTSFCAQRLTNVAGDASGEKGLTTSTIDSAPAWSPDGKRIAFWRTLDSGKVQLHVMGSNGGGDRILLGSLSPKTGVYSPPTWSPDGLSIVMVAEFWTPFYGVKAKGWSVLAVSLKPHPGVSHAKVKRLFGLPNDDENSLRWSEIRRSPNGKWFALARQIYLHNGSSTASLYVVRSNGTDLHAVTATFNEYIPDADLHAISWSPDSSRLAYVKIPDAACAHPNHPPPDLWTVSADGTNAHAVWVSTCESGSWAAPDTIAPGATTTWSPDGTEILYATEDFSATGDPNRWGYQFHEANVSTGAIQPFAVPAGDCGSGPGSCKLADPQWTRH